ncbi:hypothetical protein PMIN06_002106 [Paraphaeosphaeria minitans]
MHIATPAFARLGRISNPYAGYRSNSEQMTVLCRSGVGYGAASCDCSSIRFEQQREGATRSHSKAEVPKPII